MNPPTSRCLCGHIDITHRWRWNTQLGQGVRHQCFTTGCPCSRYEPAPAETPPDITETIHHLARELAATRRALRDANTRLRTFDERPFLPPTPNPLPPDLAAEATAFLSKEL